MRRKDRAVTEFAEIAAIVKRCAVLRLGLVDDGKAYIVPLNFGYETAADQLTLYFHSAKEGRKVEVLKKNPQVCFEMECAATIQTAEQACQWTTHYESVIGEGVVELLAAPQDRVNALERIMKTNGFEGTLQFEAAHLDAIAVYQLRVQTITAKRNQAKS